MEPGDLTVEILKSIREAIQTTNLKLEDLRGEVHATNTKLEELRDELGRRITQSEIRTAAAITALAGTVEEMTTVLRAAHDLRPRVERCEHEIEDIKRRLPASR